MAKDVSGDFLRKPPASVEAEQAILSAIITNNKAFEKVSEFLRSEHFADAAHQKVYKAAAALIEKGHLADAITLKNSLATSGELEAVGEEYLGSLAGSATSIVNAADYGKLVYDLAIKRGLIDFGTEVVNDAFGGGGEAEGADVQIEKAEQRLYDLATTGDMSGGLSTIESVMRSSVAGIEQAYKNDDGISGVSTGLRDLDKKLGGLHASDLVILAARPGMGKTTLALNIAYNVANEVANKRAPQKLSGPVAVFSLEMSSDQLAASLLAASAKVQRQKMRNGGLKEEEFQTIAEHARAISTLPLYIDDTAGISVSGIRSRARRLKRVHGGLSLIVIDYVQLIGGNPARRAENRVQEVTEITRGLKMLAKDLDVPILALSQLSRQVEQRTDRESKRPMLSDLRESGSIEQDADIVMFIYREAYYLQGKEPKDPGVKDYGEKRAEWERQWNLHKNVATIIVEKHRHGPTGDITLFYDGQYGQFGNLAKPAEEAGDA